MIDEYGAIIFPEYGKLQLTDTILKILYCLRYREMYEEVIKDKLYINKVESYYYPYDYPFPNVNLINYNTNNKSIWMKRIKAYYYYKNNDKSDIHKDQTKWYHIIT